MSATVGLLRPCLPSAFLVRRVADQSLSSDLPLMTIRGNVSTRESVLAALWIVV